MSVNSKIFLFIGIVTVLVVAIGVPLSRAFRRSLESEGPRREGTAEIYTYAAKTRHFLTVLGAFCLLFAVGPLAAIAYKYLGPGATLPSSRCCYHPVDDVTAGIGLLLGFGLGAFTCLVDPRKYFARVDEEGITVRGLFSGTRALRWADMTGIKDHPSLQMISLRGTTGGRPVRLWLPYLLASFPMLVERLNEHAFFVEGQMREVEAARAHLVAAGFPEPVPYKIFPPYLSLWRPAPGAQDFLAVLLGVKSAEPWEQAYFEVMRGQGTWLDVMAEMQKKLERGAFSFDPEMQKLFAEDFARLIEQRRAAA